MTSFKAGLPQPFLAVSSYGAMRGNVVEVAVATNKKGNLFQSTLKREF